jgi:hypothetical protein
VFIHQIAIDFGLVVKLDEELIEDSIDLARRVHFGYVQLIGPEPRFDLFEQRVWMGEITPALGRQEIGYHQAIVQARRISARHIGNDRSLALSRDHVPHGESVARARIDRHIRHSIGSPPPEQKLKHSVLTGILAGHP